MKRNTVVVQIVGALLVVAASVACAQKAAPSKAISSSGVAVDSLKEARDFTQVFFDWYVSVASADQKVAAYWKVLDARRYLDEELAIALRADSVARANYRAETRELLDIDPFLGGQDRCRLPPRVTGIRRWGHVFVVSALTCLQSTAQTDGPSVDVALVPSNGQWRIANIAYGRDWNLRSYLCKLAQTDVDPSKRPKHC